MWSTTSWIACGENMEILAHAHAVVTRLSFPSQESLGMRLATLSVGGNKIDQHHKSVYKAGVLVNFPFLCYLYTWCKCNLCPHWWGTCTWKLLLERLAVFSVLVALCLWFFLLFVQQVNLQFYYWSVPVRVSLHGQWYCWGQVKCPLYGIVRYPHFKGSDCM